jgi:hypothetical protein
VEGKVLKLVFSDRIYRSRPFGLGWWLSAMDQALGRLIRVPLEISGGTLPQYSTLREQIANAAWRSHTGGIAPGDYWRGNEYNGWQPCLWDGCGACRESGGYHDTLRIFRMVSRSTSGRVFAAAVERYDQTTGGFTRRFVVACRTMSGRVVGVLVVHDEGMSDFIRIFIDPVEAKSYRTWPLLDTLREACLSRAAEAVERELPAPDPYQPYFPPAEAGEDFAGVDFKIAPDEEVV